MEALCFSRGLHEGVDATFASVTRSGATGCSLGKKD